MEKRPPESDVANQIASPSKEKQRSRTGCKTCRSRKVKCDERPGGCVNCARLNLSCPNAPGFQQALPQQGQLAGEHHGSDGWSRTQAGLRRSRTYRSCRACRASKTRCSGERPTCVRCRDKKLDCSYDGKQAPAWVEAVTGGSTEPASPALSHGTHRSQSIIGSPSAVDGLSRPETDGSKTGTVQALEDDLKGELHPSMSWLMAESLPEGDRLMMLAEEYFANIHSLRCFGFIHKPKFMDDLDRISDSDQSNNILLYVVCALGAKFYALKPALGDQAPVPESLALQVGNQWACRAQYLLFTSLNNVSINNTMAIVLLHEHELKVGNYASAFMLTGLGVRLAQALQINLETSPNILQHRTGELAWSIRETRRRLMWSIYTMDAWVGSGVDELTLINEHDLKIQLPCNERNFTFEIPCIVETINQGQYLSFVDPERLVTGPVDTLDLQAQFLRLLTLRHKILKYVKHLDTSRLPWLPASEYSLLYNRMESWYHQLPNDLRWTQESIYLRKESAQLGGLFMLHVCYHQAICDLTRLGMKDLFKIRSSFEFPPEQAGFRRQVQDKCFENAMEVAKIFEEGLKHGPEAFADTWLPVAAHESSKIIVYYLSEELGSSRVRQAQMRPLAFSCLLANVRALRAMTSMHQLAKPLYIAASRMLLQRGFELPGLSEASSGGQPTLLQEYNLPVTNERPPQFSLDYILNPLAIYRMARSDIKENEKNAPERSNVEGAAPADSGMNTQPQGVPEPARGLSMLANNPGFLDGSLFAGNPVADSQAEFQLPTGLDDLQAYFPLMLNNFAPPMEGSLGEVGLGVSMSNVTDNGEVSNSFPGTLTSTADIAMAGTEPDPFSQMDPASRWPNYRSE